jgi:lipopolysaccharide export system protein LptC
VSGALIWTREAWDRLALYIPIILMALFALTTYWLVRNTPLVAVPGQAAPLTHEPDYFMRRFSVKTFDAAGRLKNEVSGLEARHYPDTDTLEIDKPRIRSVAPDGRETVATADRALSNGDASEVQLFGNARVVREGTGALAPRMEFTSEFLHAFLNTERVKSHKPVTMVRGSDRFTADALDYDNVERIMDLRGRVNGTLSPRPAP